jgi:hypothetical protein
MPRTVPICFFVKIVFCLQGTIILGFLIVLLNDKLLSPVGCFTAVLIQFSIQLGKNRNRISF